MEGTEVRGTKGRRSDVVQRDGVGDPAGVASAGNGPPYTWGLRTMVNRTVRAFRRGGALPNRACFGVSLRVARLFLLVGFAGAGLWPVAVVAQDKSGVSPTSISRPSGPGSLEGLGDAFQPALNTGMARYPYAFKLPDGISGFTPDFSLQYDSGLGFGPAGIGWTFDPGSIRRQSDKGIPQYRDGEVGVPSDRFLGMDGEELVPLVNGYYLAKVEGSFIRCRRVGNSWEAHAKSGTKFEFGLTDEGRVSDPTGSKIFRWCLQRQTDTNGNVIKYSYIRPVEADRQVYLSEIRYGPGGPPCPSGRPTLGPQCRRRGSRGRGQSDRRE